jgi:adenosylcobinamide-phosphate guanylyltransferase
MAGGSGSRLGGVVKPLLDVCGEPMLARVVKALSGICSRIVVSYSPRARGVGELCRVLQPPPTCIEGVGRYVEDLREALMVAGLPALVAPADMPFLSAGHLRMFIAAAMAERSDVVNLASPRGLTGLALFKSMGGSWATLEMEGEWLIDVDTPEDLEAARRMCWMDRAATG